MSFNYKVDVSYIGVFFDGWAKQKNTSNTIQETIEKILCEVLREEINILCSGRTDKDVSADQQIFSFETKNEIKIPLDKLINLLNKKLNDKKININNIKQVDIDFHARFSCISKTYRYSMLLTDKFDIKKSLFYYQTNKPIDVNKLIEIKDCFLGEHDFLSFSTSELTNTKRTINFINIIKNNNEIVIEINGNGFLKNMVRMVVAIMLEYSLNKIEKEKIINLLNNPKKGSSILIMPGNGLSLYKVIY